MDAEDPNATKASSGKVIPLVRKKETLTSNNTRGSTPPSAEEVVRQALVDAAKESDWGIAQQEDLEALESERVFRRRFGFTVNREQRRKALALKHDKDLTDPEIRRLRWSGSLDLKSEPACVRGSNFVQGFGYAMILLLILQMLLVFLLVVFADSHDVRKLMSVTIIEAVLVCMLASAYYMYIEPNQIHKRLRRQEH